MPQCFGPDAQPHRSRTLFAIAHRECCAPSGFVESSVHRRTGLQCCKLCGILSKRGRRCGHFLGGHVLEFFGWTLCTCPTTWFRHFGEDNLLKTSWGPQNVQTILGEFAVERISFPCPSAQPTTPKIDESHGAKATTPVATWIKSPPWRYHGHMCLGLSPGTCRSLPACLGGGRLACRTFEKTTCRGAGVADELWAIARRSCPWSLPRTTGTPTRTQHGTGIVDWMPSQRVCCSR